MFVPLAGCQQREIEVREAEEVFSAKLPPYNGAQHGDGVVKVRVVGVVLSRSGPLSGSPLADARFAVFPIGWPSTDPELLTVKSDSAGRFDFVVEVGAAVIVEGKDLGQIYQTTKRRVRVERDGFEPAAFLVDYQMPELKVLLKPKAP